MSDVIKELTKVGIKEEVTEGTHNPPENSDFLELLEDGLTVDSNKDVKMRNNMKGSRIAQNFRLGFTNLSVTVPVELRTGEAVGKAPNYNLLIESAGFLKEEVSTRVSTGISHTTSKVFLSDTSALKVGDCIVLKEYDLNPLNADIPNVITAIVDNTSIDLLVPTASAPSDNVEIEKFTRNKQTKNIDKTFSCSRIYDGDELVEKMKGLRTSGFELTGEAAEYPTMSFTAEGIDSEEVVETTAVGFGDSPVYDDAQPPLGVEGGFYKDGNELCIQSIGLSLGDTLSFKTCINSRFKKGSRGTGLQEITGSINPYKKHDEATFKYDNQEWSVFFYFADYGDANFKEITSFIGFHIPKVKTETKTVEDIDGRMVDSIGYRMVGDEEDGMIICFS